MPTRFTRTAIWLHWITAAVMLFMLFPGEEFMRVPRGASLAGWQPSAHASFGILVLLLALARLLWRIGHPPPALPETMPQWQVRAAQAMHAAFYVLMIAIPVAGLFALVPYAAERLDAGSVTFFKLFPVAVLPDLGGWTAEAHEWLATLAKVLVILHVLVALKHQFVDRDGLLGRMRPM